MRHKLIPAIIGGHIINDNDRLMLSLPTRLGGLGFYAETAALDHQDSMQTTASLQNYILGGDDNNMSRTEVFYIKN